MDAAAVWVNSTPIATEAMSMAASRGACPVAQMIFRPSVRSDASTSSVTAAGRSGSMSQPSKFWPWSGWIGGDYGTMSATASTLLVTMLLPPVVWGS